VWIDAAGGISFSICATAALVEPRAIIAAATDMH